ncbi:hypothetical protein KF3_072 [Vibrio phage vB_VpaS_KF3]|nr:hypothetical protein KF3_072 [Vibrio phage vB_VpaS_KF3]
MATMFVYAPTAAVMVNACRRLGISPMEPRLIRQPENLTGISFPKVGDSYIIFVTGETVPLWLHQFAVLNNVLLMAMDKHVVEYYRKHNFIAKDLRAYQQ